MLKDLTPREMFSKLQLLLTRILTKEITVPDRSSNNVQTMIDDMNRKV